MFMEKQEGRGVSATSASIALSRMADHRRSPTSTTHRTTYDTTLRSKTRGNCHRNAFFQDSKWREDDGESDFNVNLELPQILAEKLSRWSP